MLTYETQETVLSRRLSLRDLPRLLGWRSTSIWVATPTVGTTAEYDVSIVAPDDTQIVGAPMLATGPHGSTTTMADVHLGAAVSLAVSELPQNTQGLVAFDLAPSRSYIGVVLATAVLAAVVLAVGATRVGALGRETDAATTLLLAGPTLFAGLVAQPGRGSVGAQLLVAARSVLVLTGLLTFMAAATLVAGTSPHVAQDVWDGLSATAWLAVAVLTISLISPGTLLKARRYYSRQGQTGRTRPDGAATVVPTQAGSVEAPDDAGDAAPAPKQAGRSSNAPSS